MTRVLCAEQITDLNTISPDTLFIVEIGVTTQPKIIFEKGSPSSPKIRATDKAKYYKITYAGQPSKPASNAIKPAPVTVPTPAQALTPEPASVSESKAPTSAAAAAAAASVAVSKGPVPAQVTVSKAPESAPVQVPGSASKATTPAAAAAAASVAVSKAPESAPVQVPGSASKATTPAAAAASITERKEQAPAPIYKLKNQSVACYLNSAIQLLLDIPEIPEYFTENMDNDIDKFELRIPTGANDPYGCSADVSKQKENIKRLKKIFNTITTNPANNPTDILDIKNVNGSDSVYKELAITNLDGFITANGGYNEADPGEFLSSLFFPNHSCLDAANSFTNKIGVMQEYQIKCDENYGKHRSQYQSVLQFPLKSVDLTKVRDVTIKELLTEYLNEEAMDEYTDRCGNGKDPDAAENDLINNLNVINNARPETPQPTGAYIKASQDYDEYSKKLMRTYNNDENIGIKAAMNNALNDMKKAEIDTATATNTATPWSDRFVNICNATNALEKHRINSGRFGHQTGMRSVLKLQSNPDTKYIIIYINRADRDNAANQVKLQNKVLIDKEITIDDIQFRRKGCAFHVGTGPSGHYVYGSYDKDGNQNHVRNDDRIIEKPDEIVQKVFEQDGYLSTVCLYERIDPQAPTQTQSTLGGSTKTKKRKHKNKKRKTQYKNRN